jgi:hypothetical protein
MGGWKGGPRIVLAKFITLDPNPASPLCIDAFFRLLGGENDVGSLVGTPRYGPDGMMAIMHGARRLKKT